MNCILQTPGSLDLRSKYPEMQLPCRRWF